MQNKIFGKDCPPSQPDRGSQVVDVFFFSFMYANTEQNCHFLPFLL